MGARLVEIEDVYRSRYGAFLRVRDGVVPPAGKLGQLRASLGYRLRRHRRRPRRNHAPNGKLLLKAARALEPIPSGG